MAVLGVLVPVGGIVSVVAVFHRAALNVVRHNAEAFRTGAPQNTDRALNRLPGRDGETYHKNDTVHILRQRGVEVDSLPREIVVKDET